MRKEIYIAVAMIAAALLMSVLQSNAQDLEIWCTWADGSAGTGTIIRGPDGTVVLFDEGGGSDWADYAYELLDDEGITSIDYAIAGHYDSDHINGLDDLNDLMGGDSSSGDASPFGVLYDRGGSLTQSGSDIDSAYYDFVTSSGIRDTVAVDGTSDIDLGNGAVLQFLSVGEEDETEELFIRGGTSVTTDISENNKSISALLTYGGFDMYLGSDLEGTGEKAVDDVIVSDLGRSVDILLVDHHGSDSNDISSSEFLGNLDPEVAVISVWNNSHGHPRYDTVSRLQAVVEADDERIIRLSPGDSGDSSWADETMSYCHTTNSHLYITTDGSYYTVAAVTLDDGSQDDITDADLTNHSVDEASSVVTATPTPTETPTATPTPTSTPASASTPRVVINEIAWGGTAASWRHKWIELHNNTGTIIKLKNWKIRRSTFPYTIATLSGVISANGYYLVEYPGDYVVSDIAAGLVVSRFSFALPPWLSFGGEYLQLRNQFGRTIDEVDCSSGWFAGTFPAGGACTMERIDPAASGNDSSNWADNDGVTVNGLDAAGNPLNGTAGAQNSVYGTAPTPTPTPTPMPDIVVNQVCPFSSPGEYVELYNNESYDVSLEGWELDVYTGDYTFTASDVIPANGYFLVSDTDPVDGVSADVNTGIGITDNGTNSYAILIDSDGTTADTVGWASSSDYEGTILGSLSSGKAWIRAADGADTDDNSADFIEDDPDPRNSSTP